MLDIEAVEREWLTPCRHCEGAVCPQGDPRNVIDQLITEVRRLRSELSYMPEMREEIRDLNAEVRRLSAALDVRAARPDARIDRHPLIAEALRGDRYTQLTLPGLEGDS